VPKLHSTISEILYNKNKSNSRPLPLTEQKKQQQTNKQKSMFKATCVCVYWTMLRFLHCKLLIHDLYNWYQLPWSYMASFVSLISRLNNKEPGKCSSTLITWDTTWLICHHVLISTRMPVYKLYKAVFISWHLDTFWSNFMNCNLLLSLWSCTSPSKYWFSFVL